MKRLLVAVDTTSSAPFVIHEAVELARSLAGKVRLFHAVQLPMQVPPPGVFVAPPAFHVQELVAAAEETLRCLARGIPEPMRDGVEVGIGRAPEALCEAARRYDPDLVVIGAHEYGRVARALGTNAARIVDRMDRPVLVVRPLPKDHAASSDREPARSC